MVHSGRARWTGEWAVRRRRALASSQPGKLGVIENVEGLGAKFDSSLFLNGETLDQGHIEIGSPRIVQKVSRRIAEGQPARRGECAGVKQGRTKAIGAVQRWNPGFGISNHIGI